MKTSNKILLGFIILCFLIPASLLLSFKSKISHGRYTIAKQEGQGSNFRSGEIAKPYKVVKFVSPAGRVLKANIQYSDSSYYRYHLMGGGDSIRVHNEADTLFVQYFNAQQPGNPDEITNLHVDLKLPSFENLVINNAEVTLDSTSAMLDRDINVELSGTGLLNIGQMRTRRPGQDETDKVEYAYNINHLSVKMNEGEMTIGSKVDIKQLDIQAQDKGVLIINDGAAIAGMTGRLSETFSVNANWKYVKRLAALSTE